MEREEMINTCDVADMLCSSNKTDGNALVLFQINKKYLDHELERTINVTTWTQDNVGDDGNLCITINDRTRRGYYSCTLEGKPHDVQKFLVKKKHVIRDAHLPNNSIIKLTTNE